MRHNYRRMLIYDPVKKKVIKYRPLAEKYIFQSGWYEEVFNSLWEISDHNREVVLGFSLNGDLYQLSPADYGTYIKEDLYSAQTIPKGSVLAAIARYKQQHNLPFDED